MKNKTTTAKLVRIIAACAVILIISMMPKQMNAQWSTNPALNTAICTASGEQQAQSAISDGLGGALLYGRTLEMEVIMISMCSELTHLELFNGQPMGLLFALLQTINLIQKLFQMVQEVP